jgi:hypothetical protein
MAKKYIKGSAKAVQTQYGEIINLSLSLEDLKTCKLHKGFIRLQITKRQSEGQFGETHSVSENTYESNS